MYYLKTFAANATKCRTTMTAKELRMIGTSRAAFSALCSSISRAMARSIAAGIAGFLVLVMAGFTAEIEARLRVFFVVLPVRNRNHQERTKRKTTGRTPNERKEERGPALWLGCFSWGWLARSLLSHYAGNRQICGPATARCDKGNILKLNCPWLWARGLSIDVLSVASLLCRLR